MRGQAKHVPMVSRLASFRVAEGASARSCTNHVQWVPLTLYFLLLIDTEDELSDDITKCGARWMWTQRRPLDT